MAADVGTYHKNDGLPYHKSIRVLKMNETSQHLSANTDLITRDLLGQSFSQPSGINKSCELDLDFEVPSGWQKHLDLKSGKVYLQKHNTKVKGPLDSMKDVNLELRLTTSTRSTYESVCSLDAIKSALDRAKNNENLGTMFFLANGSSSHSTHKMNLKPESHMQQGLLLSAAGCPNCLLYVMISDDKPKCPKCCSTVCLPVMNKSRIDLDLKI